MTTAESEMDIDDQKTAVKKSPENGEPPSELTANPKKICNGSNDKDEEVPMETESNHSTSLPNGKDHSESSEQEDQQVEESDKGGQNENLEMKEDLGSDTKDVKGSEEKDDESRSLQVEKKVDENGSEEVDTNDKDVKEAEKSSHEIDSVKESENNQSENEETKEKETKDPIEDKDSSDNSNGGTELDKENVSDVTTNDLKQEKKSKNGDNSDCEVIEDDSKEADDKKDLEKTEESSSPKASVAVKEDNDDIEIVGESKPITIDGPNPKASSPNIVLLQQNVSGSVASPKGLPSTTLLARNLQQSGQRLPTILGGNNVTSNIVISGATSSPSLQSLTQSAAPPKPKSSLDQIELIRWEIANRINTRPKYFKPNPTSELGPLSKFLFDMGSDLIKESVYHELVQIQSKKSDEEKLSEKEQNDLDKLKDIEKDLHSTIGHLKLKMKKRCKTCQFQTESLNVMFFHKQFPHEEEKLLYCAHCKFQTKQPSAFKFHAEAEHNMQPRMHDKKQFYECNMCPYENNQEQKVVIHKQRCLKQFRPHFNLHPSCLSGAEINLCLENIFYKPVIPKGLKILQQKHAQQQAALAEARRQQAQVQALAAQKNKPQLRNNNLVRPTQPIAPRQQGQPQRMPMQRGQIPLQIRNQLQQQARPRLPEKGRNTRPTVANMLNNRQNLQAKGPSGPPAGQAPAGKAPGGFEVCEICGGYVKDRKALRIHFFYAHRIDLPFNLFERQLAPLYCATCYVRFWTAQGLRKHIDTHKEENATTGVVGKCISCGHHVLNLLIHMRIVHNREIQHYINALMCMFCGMHFGSRGDVDNHIKKVHGLIDPATGAIKSSKSVASSPAARGNAKKAGGQPVKGSVCVLCNLNFGRNVDLTRHCMRMHHTCMKCGMVVIDKASLMKHACLSSPSGTRDCSMCKENGFHPAYFVKHLRDKHLKKFSIQVSRLSKGVIERWTKRPYQDEKVLVEISDSSDDEGTAKKVAVQPPAKRPRLGPASFMKKSEKADADVVQVIDDDDEPVEKSKKEESTKKATDNDVETVDNEKEPEKNGAEESSNGELVEKENNVEKTNESEEKDIEEKDSVKDEVKENGNESEGNNSKESDEGKGEEKECLDNSDIKSEEVSDKSEKNESEIKDDDIAERKTGEKRKMGPLSYQNKKQKSS